MVGAGSGIGVTWNPTLAAQFGWQNWTLCSGPRPGRARVMAGHGGAGTSAGPTTSIVLRFGPPSH
jgi:hypothetical protein